MGKQKPRYWFSAWGRGSGQIVHIVSAHSIAEVREHFGLQSEVLAIEHLTCTEINRLAGVAASGLESGEGFAEGPLMYEHDGHTISIEVVD